MVICLCDISDRSPTLQKTLSNSPNKPTPFWSVLRADIRRFQEEGHGFRGVIRGVVSQGFWALLGYRIFRWFYERKLPTQPVRFVIERFIEITTGISIPAQAKIGKGLRIHHFGGIFFHSDVVMGEGCTIYQGVTLGDLGGWGGVPRVGNRVIFGAGAKLIGSIEVGDDCRIGANAVVLTSVPARCVAVGVPAVVKQRSCSRQVLASEELPFMYHQ